MAVIRPWDAIPEAVLAIEPHILDDASIRNGELDVEQKEVLQVIWSDLKLVQHIKVNLACTQRNIIPYSVPFFFWEGCELYPAGDSGISGGGRIHALLEQEGLYT